jgi:hypothetical protein
MMLTGMFRNSTRFTQSSSSIYLRNLGLRFSSTTIKHAQPPKPPTGVKKLIQQYGYSALGIYLGISLIDLPICFLVVHSAGEEKIRELQDKFLTWIGYKNSAGSTNTDDGLDTTTNKEREEEKSSTLVTEFALAYAIHKSLIFVRLPLTAAITPWVVARLQKWGFKVGKAAIVKTAAKGKKFDPTGKSAKFD